MITQPSINRLISDIRSLATTFIIAVTTGLFCQYLDLPAPFLLGSLFGAWCIGAAVTPVQNKLGVPRWFHVPVILGLGTLIGGNFGPDTIPQMHNWATTIIAMIAATILATLAGLFF